MLKYFGRDNIINVYSEKTSTGATRGLSANQKPILKQRNERVDLSGNFHIFSLVTFDPKFLAVFENFARFRYG